MQLPESLAARIQSLDTAPPDAREFFDHRIENDKLWFSIRETIMITHKL